MDPRSYRVYDKDGEYVSDFESDTPVTSEDWVSYGNPETDILEEYDSDQEMADEIERELDYCIETGQYD